MVYVSSTYHLRIIYVSTYLRIIYVSSTYLRIYVSFTYRLRIYVSSTYHPRIYLCNLFPVERVAVCVHVGGCVSAPRVTGDEDGVGAPVCGSGDAPKTVNFEQVLRCREVPRYKSLLHLLVQGTVIRLLWLITRRRNIFHYWKSQGTLIILECSFLLFTKLLVKSL